MRGRPSLLGELLRTSLVALLSLGLCGAFQWMTGERLPAWLSILGVATLSVAFLFLAAAIFGGRRGGRRGGRWD